MSSSLASTLFNSPIVVVVVVAVGIFLSCCGMVLLLQTILERHNMGKVHGSLARAGKVKGQTPKVEAQEDKKKLPRGRAKKRLQYNRRYVNVVTGMGGKKVGPNSNADKMK